MEIKKFENKLIAFDFDNNTVNATDMVKNFKSKKVNDFLRLKETKDFATELEKSLNTGIPVINKKVGKGGGTWIHKLLGYKLAAWLSPKFELFVYQTFDKEIQKQLSKQQRELDYFWDKEDQKDLYS